MQKTLTTRGFTLIEVLVYLALFAILVGGGVVGAYNLFESTGRQQTHAMLQEEGTFLMGKIGWAISGAQAVNAPGGGLYGSQLSVSKVTGLDGSGQPIITTVVLTHAGTNIEMTNGANPAQVLNNSDVQVVSMRFLHTLASGNGIIPESVEASTTLAARAPNGMVVTQDFSTTVYVRR